MVYQVEIDIRYIHEPTDLQCGQAVLAMVLGKTVDEIVQRQRNYFKRNERYPAKFRSQYIR